ncbi:MAG: hypothetical protein K0R98_1280 [Rickettsiaceae bacterium]|nr:hypothetical protein [Rickettsiaceae bacterium]
MENGEKPVRPPEQDKRITNIILDHWNAIRGLKKYPAETDLDPALLEELLDNCFLIKTEGIFEGKYNYKFLGKNIMNAYGSDLTRSLNDSAENPFSQRDKIKELITHEHPIIDEGEFHNINKDIIKYRQCLVPLSSDGINIDSVFGGMRFIIIPNNNA